MSVHFFKYYCRCGSYLFDNGHIVESSTCARRSYVFIEDSPNRNFSVFGSNIVRCASCSRALGGMCYRKWRNELYDWVRFARHLLYRQKVYFDVNRVLDENGIITSKYRVRLLYGNIQSVQNWISIKHKICIFLFVFCLNKIKYFIQTIDSMYHSIRSECSRCWFCVKAGLFLFFFLFCWSTCQALWSIQNGNRASNVLWAKWHIPPF